MAMVKHGRKRGRKVMAVMNDVVFALKEEKPMANEVWIESF
jgi:hypothetical protein